MDETGWVYEGSSGAMIAPLISKYIWPRPVRNAIFAVEIPTTLREALLAAFVLPLHLLAIPGVYRWTSSRVSTFALGYAEGYVVAVASPMRLTRQRALVRWELTKPTVELLSVGRKNTRIRLDGRKISVPNAVAPDLLEMLGKRPEESRDQT